MRNCASGNLEIPGSMLTHRPGMTVKQRRPSNIVETAASGGRCIAAGFGLYSDQFQHDPDPQAAPAQSGYRFSERIRLNQEKIRGATP
jgi:hypothetical protein